MLQQIQKSFSEINIIPSFITCLKDLFLHSHYNASYMLDKVHEMIAYVGRKHGICTFNEE